MSHARSTRLAVAAAAAIAVSGAFASTSAALSLDRYSRNASGGVPVSCGSFIDPVGMVFVGKSAVPSRITKLIERRMPGFKSGRDNSQAMNNNGFCRRTSYANDNGSLAGDRFHIRLGGVYDYIPGPPNQVGRFVFQQDSKGNNYTLGTPHYDDYRRAPGCGAKGNHINPVGGFKKARLRFKAAFRAAGYRTRSVRWNNTAKRIQCDGTPSQGDGVVTYVYTR